MVLALARRFSAPPEGQHIQITTQLFEFLLTRGIYRSGRMTDARRTDHAARMEVVLHDGHTESGLELKSNQRKVAVELGARFGDAPLLIEVPDAYEDIG